MHSHSAQPWIVQGKEDDGDSGAKHGGGGSDEGGNTNDDSGPADGSK